jgi:pimeloyl-ACP methyl ester carboxylesterase
VRFLPDIWLSNTITMKRFNLFIAAMFLLFSSCVAEMPAGKSYLVTAPEVQKHSVKEIREHAASSYGMAAALVNMQYGVSVRRITYNTTYKGQTIKASGVVCIPQGMKKAAPLLSMQHGTIFHNSEAPSNASWSHREFEMLASSGYIVFVPDYIGYGESRQVFHPYYDYEHSAASVVDMLRAGLELLGRESIKHNGKVALTGYSEGGYVTLAAHKKLESEPVKGLKVIGSAAGAGGYDLPGVLKSALVEKKEYPAPAYLTFVLMSYNTTYDWKRPLTDFFGKKYASALPGLMDKQHYGSAVNKSLTPDIGELFNNEFFKSLKGQGEAEVKAMLAKNSVHDWKPEAPVQLYHGTADEIVPYSNSVITYENFKKNGAKDVTLIPIEGGTHGSTFMPMLLSLVGWLNDLDG